MIAQQLPADFLKQLAEQQNRETYVRITSLTFADELPVEAIEGRITQGSINLDGKSSMRRSVSLTMISNDLNIDNYLWGLNHKFKLELGVKNYSNPKFPDIIWFNYGKYVFTAFNPNYAINNYTISLTGQDKMCLLNGTVGGNLNALNYRFDVIEEEDADGNIIQKKLPLKSIITEAVHKFGNEPYHNIVVNDLDDEDQLNLIQYNGENYFYLGYSPNGKVIQLSGETECNFNGNQIQIKDLEQENGKYYVSSELINDQSSETKVSINGEEYYIQRIAPGQTIGYTTQELTYPKELTAKTGDTLTSVLDNIKKIIPGYEYFYDNDGRFVFQKNKTGVELPYSPEIDGTGAYIPMLLSSEIAFTFNNDQINTSFRDSPQYNNIKNDFSVWGSRTTAGGVEVPILYRYVVGKKPVYYKTIQIEESDLEYFNNRFQPEVKRQFPKYEGGKIYTTEDYDWREIIYQMALDQDRWGAYLDDFSVRLAAANPQYPDGKTGYESYYTDFLSFWRQIYNKTPEDSYSLFAIPSFGTKDSFVVKDDIKLFVQEEQNFEINSTVDFNKYIENIKNQLSVSGQVLTTLNSQWQNNICINSSDSSDDFALFKFLLFLINNHNTGFKIKGESKTLEEMISSGFSMINTYDVKNIELPENIVEEEIDKNASMDQIIEVLEKIYQYLTITQTDGIDFFEYIPYSLPFGIIEGIQKYRMSMKQKDDSMIDPQEDDLEQINILITDLKEIRNQTKYQYISIDNQIVHFNNVLKERDAAEILDRLQWVIKDWGNILSYYHFNCRLFNNFNYIEAKGAELAEDNNMYIYDITNSNTILYYYDYQQELYIPDVGIELTNQQDLKNIKINKKIEKITYAQAQNANLKLDNIIYKSNEANEIHKFLIKQQQLPDLYKRLKTWIDVFDQGIVKKGFDNQIKQEQNLLLRYDADLGEIIFNTTPWIYQEYNSEQKNELPILTSINNTSLDSLFWRKIELQMTKTLFYQSFLKGSNQDSYSWTFYEKDNNGNVISASKFIFYSLRQILNLLKNVLEEDNQQLNNVIIALNNCSFQPHIVGNEDSYISNNGELNKEYKNLMQELNKLVIELNNQISTFQKYNFYRVEEEQEMKIIDLINDYNFFKTVNNTILLTPTLDKEKTIPIKYYGNIELIPFYDQQKGINKFYYNTNEFGSTDKKLYNITGKEISVISEGFKSYMHYYDDAKTISIRYYTKDELWDKKTGWHINVSKAPDLLNFWFEMFNSDFTALSRYSVDKIGNRTKTLNDTKIKTLFNYNTPAIILKYGNQNPAEREGYEILDLEMTEEEFNTNFVVSSQSLSAKNKIEELMEKHLFKNSSLSITTMPIYHLEPNSRIRVINSQMNLDSEYITSKLTIPLTYNGTMTITGSLAPINIY